MTKQPTGTGVWKSNPVTDALASFVWPRLFSAATLALHPGRVGIAFVIVLLVALLGRLPELWLGGEEGPGRLALRLARPAIDRVFGGVLGLNHVDLGGGIWQLMYEMPRQVFSEYPWSTVIMMLPVLAVWGVGGGAISRMAAAEFSLGVYMPWTKGLGFALSRPLSLAACLIMPPIIVGIIGVIVAAAGWLLMGWPGVQVVGGVLYAGALLAALFAVVGLAGYAIGTPLLVPAVACEGTDAIDSVQRSYAYVIGRPFRVVVYSLLLLVQFVLLAGVLVLLAKGVQHFAAEVTAAWVTGTDREVIVLSGTGHDLPPGATLTGSQRAMAWMVGFWSLIPGLIVLSTLVSFYFSGSTVLYLLVRQVCDGQDPGDLWSPGMVAGTMANVDEVDSDDGEETDDQDA